MENDYGTITVGRGTPEQHEIKIREYLRCVYKDNRFVSVILLEDGSYVFTVENLKSSGRGPQTSMWLSKESAIAMIATAMMFFSFSGSDLEKLLEDSVSGGEVSFDFSENLKPIVPFKTKKQKNDHKK